jgi:hypothetical protein
MKRSQKNGEKTSAVGTGAVVAERDEQGRKKDLTRSTLRAVFIPELLRYIAHFIGSYAASLPVLFVSKLAYKNLKPETPNPRVVVHRYARSTGSIEADEGEAMEAFVQEVLQGGRIDRLDQLDQVLPYMASAPLAEWARDTLHMRWDFITAYAAIAGGVVDVATRFAGAGYFSQNVCACTLAAGNGHLEMLKWARSQDPPCPWDEETCSRAAENGHLDVLKWARSQDPPCPWDASTCSRAAENGHLDVLQWARSQDPPCPWDEWTCSSAARSGHLDVLKWLRAQDPSCPWDEWTCSSAAENGHLDVLLWARSQDPPCAWDTRTCSWAAYNGHLDVLKWARSQDPPCPWDEGTCSYAAENSQLEVLQWLRAHGAPERNDDWQEEPGEGQGDF